ncbi:GNAT family N-acetyltransferase [Herbidospora mongoliensis]|uniref:GNAT family N-acetyltransferase n=1 Tax=Herbidospora mongoliensis TaxID=688067 RepID=UPI00082EE3DD|nr:GNAT family N-acetyltransferase [Herbidospora mongoliensis]
MAQHILDNPAWASLTGPHAHLAEVRGGVRRYPVDVSVFVALQGDPAPEDWADIAAFAKPDGTVSVTGGNARPPEGWEVQFSIAGVQLDGSAVYGAADPEAVRLGPADVPDMLDLVARTEPGPFLPRTIEMGTYLGLRHEGKLIAMAGERLHPPGWTEISAVCTDPSYRGQGLATRLVLAVAAGIRARGETPFMHAAASNVNAIRLYESLGFTLRLRTTFNQLKVP